MYIYVPMVQLSAYLDNHYIKWKRYTIHSSMSEAGFNLCAVFIAVTQTVNIHT